MRLEFWEHFGHECWISIKRGLFQRKWNWFLYWSSLTFRNEAFWTLHCIESQQQWRLTLVFSQQKMLDWPASNLRGVTSKQENLRLFHVFVKRLKSATYHGFFTKGQLIALMCNFFRAFFFALWQKCVVLFHTKTITASFYNFFSFEMSRIKSFVYAKGKLYFFFLFSNHLESYMGYKDFLHFWILFTK